MIKILFGKELKIYNLFTKEAETLEKAAENYKKELKEEQQREIFSQTKYIKLREIQFKENLETYYEKEIKNLKNQMIKKDKLISKQRNKITKLILDMDKLQKVLK